MGPGDGSVNRSDVCLSVSWHAPLSAGSSVSAFSSALGSARVPPAREDSGQATEGTAPAVPGLGCSMHNEKLLGFKVDFVSPKSV